MYNDCHPLSTGAADMDSSINTALWFIKYTSDDSECSLDVHTIE